MTWIPVTNDSNAVITVFASRLYGGDVRRVQGRPACGRRTRGVEAIVGMWK